MVPSLIRFPRVPRLNGKCLSSAGASRKPSELTGGVWVAANFDSPVSVSGFNAIVRFILALLKHQCADLTFPRTDGECYEGGARLTKAPAMRSLMRDRMSAAAVRGGLSLRLRSSGRAESLNVFA